MQSLRCRRPRFRVGSQAAPPSRHHGGLSRTPRALAASGLQGSLKESSSSLEPNTMTDTLYSTPKLYGAPLPISPLYYVVAPSNRGVVGTISPLPLRLRGPARVARWKGCEKGALFRPCLLLQHISSSVVFSGRDSLRSSKSLAKRGNTDGDRPSDRRQCVCCRQPTVP